MFPYLPERTPNILGGLTSKGQGRIQLEPTPVADFRQTLIIRACAIGDFVLNLPALQALSQLRFDTRFVLVGYPTRLDLAREFIPVENIHSIESEPWNRLFHEPVSGLNFASAVVWMKDPAFAENLRLSGIAEVLHRSPFPVFGHAAAHLLRTLQLAEPPLPDLWRGESDDIIVHSTSGSASKNWPHFDELMNRLGTKALSLWERAGEARVRATSSANPVTLTRRFAPPSPKGRGLRTLENLSLRQVAGHLRRCRAYIGNDSGITHLAAYLGCPTVALFGPTDPRQWGPIGRRTRIIWKTKLEDISVDEVLQALP